MGWPVRGLDDLISSQSYIDENYESISAFFLYHGQDHTAFAAFIREQFLWLDEESSRSTFFFLINEPPEEWRETAQQREYWQQFMAKNRGKSLHFDNDNIFDIIDHFDINPACMPCIVLFKSLKSDTFVIVHGKILSEEEPEEPRRKEFFKKLFQFNECFLRKEQERLIRNASHARDEIHRPNFPVNAYAGRLEKQLSGYGLDVQVKRHVGHRMENIFEKLVEERLNRIDSRMTDFEHAQGRRHKEVIGEIRSIRTSLQNISEEIKSYRSQLIDDIMDMVNKDTDLDVRVAEVDSLHDQFDVRIMGCLEKLRERFERKIRDLPKNDIPISSDLIPFLSDESKSFVKTSEVIYRQALEQRMPYFDYSVCGIGLWKTLELELNLSFMDWLRLKTKIIDVMPYLNKASRVSSPIEIYTGTHRTTGRDFNVNINDMENGKLKGIMLGPISHILENGERNQLKELVENVLPETRDDIFGGRINNKNIGLPHDIRKVTNKFRNSHAHVKMMDVNTVNQFRAFMYDQMRQGNEGLIPRVLMYKRSILNCVQHRNI